MTNDVRGHVGRIEGRWRGEGKKGETEEMRREEMNSEEMNREKGKTKCFEEEEKELKEIRKRRNEFKKGGGNPRRRG